MVHYTSLNPLNKRQYANNKQLDKAGQRLPLIELLYQLETNLKMILQ